MTERELLELWNKNRQQIVVSQFAPTFLLIISAGLILAGLGAAPLFVSLIVLFILLASGILGALVQYASATEAMAVAEDLKHVKAPSAVTKQAIKFAPWLNVVRFVTPAIFIIIFLLFATTLLFGR
jgi:hypothetical protein